jgi:hypothetical protein
MTRSALAPALAIIFSAAIVSAAFTQSKPAGSGTAPGAPASRAKWVPTVKGLATIDVFRKAPKKVGNEVHTVLVIKNTSSGAIALLRADEYWYDTSRKMVSGDTQRWRQPFHPGEIIEITMKSPFRPNLTQSQINFEHANGKVQAKGLKSSPPPNKD